MKTDFKKTVLLVILILLYNSSNFAQKLNDERIATSVERQLLEITKLVSLTPTQIDTFSKICEKYQLKLDSALYFEKNPINYISKIDNAEKEFTIAFYDALSEKQTIEYVNKKGFAAIRHKTDYIINLLQESRAYTKKELVKIEKRVFNYLMLEEVAFMRYKYDLAKQKENLHRLKTIQPAQIKVAETHRNLKLDGKIQNGKVNWNN